MANMKTPKPVNDPVRPKFKVGSANVLAETGTVVGALGKPLGFVVIMTALLAGPISIAIVLVVKAWWH
jgi:hypothetical protein